MKRVFSLILLAGLLGLGVWFFFKEQATPWKRERPLNVLLITLDTTRADHLPAYGYEGVETPNLDALAARGMVFESAFTPTNLTLPAHASIMTGLNPPKHGLHINGAGALADSHVTLAERFTQAGYATSAFVAAFVLDRRWGIAQGFTHYDDNLEADETATIDLGSVQRPANEVVDAALSWLDKQGEQPFFSWVHLYDAHTPYAPPEPYRSRYDNGTVIGAYDGEIAFLDAQVGRLLDALKARALEEDTLVIVAADHGEALGDHDEETHGFFIYDEVVHVPLIIHLPGIGLSGQRISQVTSLVDLAPTIEDIMGWPTQPTDGRSLTPAILKPDSDVQRLVYMESKTPHLQYGWSPLEGMRGSNFKYIRAPQEEFYDLIRDPGEARNVVRALQKEVAHYRSALEEELAEVDETATAQEADLDDETLRMLASLGYLGAPVKVSKGTLADPKDKLDIFKATDAAAISVLREEYSEAAVALRKVIEEDPKVAQARLLLATCEEKLGNHEAARTQLDTLLKDDPTHGQALIGMAHLLQKEGKDPEVVSLCKAALASDQSNRHALALMGGAYLRQGQYSEAKQTFEKLVQAGSDLMRHRQNLAAAHIGEGSWETAERMLQDILAENQRFPLAHFHMGLVHEGRKALTQAKQAYENELALHPGTLPARFNLSKLLWQAGDLDGYLEQMNTLVRQFPEDAKGYLFLARGLLQKGELQRAESHAQKGLEKALTPDLQALGWFLLADTYNRLGRKADAQQAAEKGKHYRGLIKTQ